MLALSWSLLMTILTIFDGDMQVSQAQLLTLKGLFSSLDFLIILNFTWGYRAKSEK